MRRTILTLIFTLIVIFAILLTTNLGLRWAFNVSNLLLPGKLTVSKLEGSIINKFKIHELAYSSRYTKLKVKYFLLAWEPSKLFKGTLSITDIDGDRISYYQKSAAEDNNNGGGFPLAISIKNVNLNKIHVQLDNESPPITINQLEFHTVIKDKHITIQGGWSDLRFPIDNTKTLESPVGKLNAAGNINSYEINMSGKINGDALPIMDWSISGHGNKHVLNLPNINISTLGGRVKGNAIIHMHKLAWEMNIEGKNINPAKQWPDWQGNLNFKLSGSGSKPKGKYQLDLNLKSISGKLFNNPISGKAFLKLRDDDLDQFSINANYGEAIIKTQGSITNAWDVMWDINVPSFTKLVPDSTGKFKSSGKIQGDRTAPKIIGHIDGSNIKFSHYHANQINMNLNVDLQDTGKIDADFLAQDIAYNDYKYDKLTLNAKGDMNAHNISIGIQEDSQKLNADFSGKLHKQDWQGQLTKLNLVSSAYNNWKLKAPVDLSIAPQKMSLGELCWLSTKEELCLQGDWHGGSAFTSNFSGNNLQLKMFKPFFPDHVKLSGTSNFIGKLKSSHKGTLRGDVDVKISSGGIHYFIDDKPQTLKFLNGKAHAEITRKGLSSKLKITLPKEQLIKGSLSLPDYTKLEMPGPKQKIDANLNIHFNDLKIIEVLYPQLKNSQGDLLIEFSAKGKLSNPKLIGRANITNGSTEVIPLNTKIKNIAVHAQTVGKHKIQYSGHAESGKGKIQLNGKLEFKDENINSETHIKGKDFEVIKTHEYHALASPDITVKSEDDRIDINGKIHIPKANINPEELAGGSVKLSDDVVFVKDGEIISDEDALNLHSRITLSFGKKVYLNLLGMRGRLGGKVTIVDHPNRPTTGDGEINIIDGKFIAYGQNLNIQNGQLIFTGGPVDNPILDIEAVRTINTAGFQNIQSGPGTSQTGAFAGGASSVTVGVEVTGTLKDYKVSLFSSPISYSQGDILAMLLLGKPASQASGADSQVLLSALSTMKFGGDESSQIGDQFANTFGLDAVGVETQPHRSDERTDEYVETTSLVLSKTLSSRFIVNYSFGLTAPLNTLKLKYLLGKKWSIESETSVQSTSIDLLYRIERD